jgi:hypothetical protein
VSGGRGRTTATLAPLVAASAPPTPQPTQAPSAAPTTAPRTGAPAATVAPGGTGGQPGAAVGTLQSGAPGVSGPGGTGARTASPSPTQRIVAEGVPPRTAGDRFVFRVFDSRTGQPLAGVCVVLGTACGPNDYYTNSLGYWWLDLQPGMATSWSFKFIKDGYVSPTIARTYRPGIGSRPSEIELRRR